MPMLSTWLIQRLKLPPQSELAAKASRVFSGAGIGLSSDAWTLLQQIFDIDYMGAAEYEFGSLPRSWQAFVADRTSLVAFTQTLARKDIAPNPEWQWRGREARRRVLAAAKAAGKKPPRARAGAYVSSMRNVSVFASVYVICRLDQQSDVKDRIAALAADELRVRDSIHFISALDPLTDRDHEVCGWYELDNGFFFFTNKMMWQKTARLFSVPRPRCGKYLGDNDGTCPQLWCIRDEDHEGLCDNVRGDDSSRVIADQP